MDAKRNDLTARNFPTAEEDAQAVTDAARYAGPESAYRLLMQQLSNAADAHAAATARDPIDAAVKIAKALEANRPRFRYTVGPLAAFNHFAHGKIPSRLLRAMVSRYLGLNRIRL